MLKSYLIHQPLSKDMALRLLSCAITSIRILTIVSYTFAFNMFGSPIVRPQSISQHFHSSFVYKINHPRNNSVGKEKMKIAVSSIRRLSVEYSYSSLSSAPETTKREIMNDCLYRISECNRKPKNTSFLDFIVDDCVVGKVTSKVAKCLCDANNAGDAIFQINSSRNDPESAVLLLTDAAGDCCESRTASVMSIMNNLRSRGIVTGWRDELYPVSKGFYNEPLFLVERAAASYLGALQYGVHINGIVQEGNGIEKMWIARRSKTKSKYPGMLDHIVAGGQPVGISLFENVIKECMEEAGIEKDTAMNARPASAISYEDFTKIDHHDEIDGIVDRVILFNYDLELPKQFEPVAVDGEVESFFLWGVDELFESMHKDYYDPIKPNCYLVIIDYLMRKGYILPDTPGYLDVLRELRSGHCA